MDGHTPNPNQFSNGETYFCVVRDSSTFYSFKVTAVVRTTAEDRNIAYDEVKCFDGKTSQWLKIQTHTRADGVRVEFVQFPHTRPSWADQTAENVFGEEWVAVSQEQWTQ
tara:strand:- start:46033 stop:46362 length:330 start_codon:yes stop_codon:yes gene_type:complete